MSEPTAMNRLVAAIVDDEVRDVNRLLRADVGLATRLIETERLYDAGIAHWIYTGDTALHLAAAGYRVDIIRSLLTAGADPNAAHNRRRGTPLHYAADGCITVPAWNEKHQLAAIRCLLEHGADLHAADANGATPLHRAVRTRCAGAVKLLLEAGAVPVRRNQAGSTAFHLAVQNTGRGGSGEPDAVRAQREIIAAFLAHGISPRLRDGRGRSVTASARSDWIRKLLDAAR